VLRSVKCACAGAEIGWRGSELTRTYTYIIDQGIDRYLDTYIVIGIGIPLGRQVNPLYIYVRIPI